MSPVAGADCLRRSAAPASGWATVGRVSKPTLQPVTTSARYCFRAAYDSNAFHQFQPLDPSKLSREARERGIRCSPFASTFSQELERLDREGAFRPILFEMDDASSGGAVVFRDEVDFVPWSEYVVAGNATATPRPRYSPWQLLYLNDAIEMPKAEVPAQWLLDDGCARTISERYREFARARLKDLGQPRP